ncbi:MAG: TlpA disulfide reductase family protein [Psychroflexus sp.]|jgi:peroxiredoxin|nr:TlpA disulfide reductase family protein [Psychroflexus sp.]MDR9447806.1 TlpA disulfide reductase family protein [Psychroflexus sp.]
MKTLLKFTIILIIPISAISQDKLPDIDVKDLKNRTVNLKSDFSEKDKIYVFSFWATWCMPCLKELEAINEHYDEWSEELNMELVAISIDDSRTKKRIRPLVNGRNWPYTVLHDENQTLKRALSIVNIPYTLVVKNNNIEHIFNGYSQGSEEEMYKSLKKL